MKIFFDKLYRDDRIKELCGICVPFKRGDLSSAKVSTVRILDGKRAVPIQVETTALWDDGSVKYIYVHFLADLPGNAKKELILTYEGDRDYEEKALPAQNGVGINGELFVKENSGSIFVDNGALKFTVTDDSDRLFDSFEYDGKSLDKEQFAGPLVRIKKERLKTRFDSWKVVKKGSVLTVLEGKGRHISKDADRLSKEDIRFEVRLSVTASKPWIDIGYRFINATDGEIKPDDILFSVKVAPDKEAPMDSPLVEDMCVDSTGCGDTKGSSDLGDFVTFVGTGNLPGYEYGKGEDLGNIRTIAGKSNYKTEFKISKTGKTVENTITAENLQKEANEHFAEVFYGTFFGDVTDLSKDMGICVTVYQAFQNFPKAIKATEDGLTVFLIPDQDLNREKTRAYPVSFASGMAKEQRFLLHFHDAGEPLYELDNRSLIYQMPDKPYIDPMEFSKAGVFPDVFLPVDEQDDDVETILVDRADSHVRSYGMLNFGDGPDPGYTDQGRGGGNLVWTNNEYDYPHAMFMMYARSGIRRFLDYAIAAAYHWMDVDVCHYSSDPLRLGGQWEHTRRHTGGSEKGRGSEGEMVCSHEWVEGLLDLYHFTSDERALNTAIGIGENVLRLLDTPMYQVPGEANARETGWALRTLTALYVETGDKKWVERCQWIVSQFDLWNDRYGVWLSPYTDNTTIRVGFMISVALGSLMRYYRIFPSDELKEMMLHAVDDLRENYMTEHGMFIYKELPSLSRTGTNTLLLEAMSIGYELTNDPAYLECGYKTFKKALSNPTGGRSDKRIVEDAVLSGGGAPKNFAQSFYPITGFYVNLVRANRRSEQGVQQSLVNDCKEKI